MDETKAKIKNYLEIINPNIGDIEAELVDFSIDEVIDRVLLYLNSDIIPIKTERILANIVNTGLKKCQREIELSSDGNMVERCVMQALKNDITILSMHTNMDNAYRGVSYTMAERLGMSDVAFLQPKGSTQAEGGSGVIGMLPQSMKAADFVHLLKDTFHAECVMTNALMQRPIRRVALCGGSGAFLAEEALRQQADAFVTGEMHYHDYFGLEQQIQLCIIGHYESEQYSVQRLDEVLAEALPTVRRVIYPHTTNPILYF